ncbi:MAG: sensor histidine kinase [Dehalococcoidia bacterium]
MTALQRIGAGQTRLFVAIVLTTALVTAAHASVEAALSGEWDWRIYATDIATAALVIVVAALYLRAVAKERRREVVEHLLLDILSMPRNIEGTAIAALKQIHDARIADASIVALDGDGGPMKPLVARGYPRGWVESAPAAAVERLASEPTVDRPKALHPWVEAASVPLGKRPWVALLPLRAGSETIGLILLTARRPGVLRDPVVLDLLATRLSAAFDHAALYEAAYARERELEDLETRRREFMAAIAHEIRTPLTSIQAFADLLQMGEAEMDDTARDLVASLGHGVQRLSSMVTNLIDLGRSGEAGYAVQETAVDLGEMVRGAEAALRPAMVLRGQEVILELPERGPRVLSDPRIVEQVVMNLLANANRHSPERGHISVTASQLDHNTVRLEVADTGPGVPEAEREKIFQPYYRVRGSASMPGSGLGLAVARRLLEETGGRVWVTDATGGGARFCVEFRAFHP